MSNLVCFAQTYRVEEVSYEFFIQPVEGLNTKYDEFSPVLINDQLVFTSGRESNLVLKGENNWKKTGVYNVFSTSFKQKDSTEIQVNVPQLFAKEISNNNHTGPVCFDGENRVFFTQLSERKKRIKEIRHPQLYMADKVDGKWQNIVRLPFCRDEFSFGHPCWDPINRYLYYSSDIEGGKGGNDIYKVHLDENGEWGKPVNLEINTASDEMFPFIIGNDLFFSSDREGGKGDLDIYWKILGSKEPLKNVDQLNTVADDHGLFITPNHMLGYFAKRENGQDDIYQLSVTRKVRVTNELAGQFIYRNLGTEASGLELQLLQEDDVIFDVNADEEGKFRFRELPHDNYTIKTMASDNLELVLFDENGRPNTYLLQDGEGKFQYKKVDRDLAGTLTLLEEMNGKWLDYTDITGQFVYENIPGEYGDSLEVMLVDEDGNIIFTEYTDKRGNFTFINVPTDQNYTITTENADEDMFLLIFDQDGNVHVQLKQNQQGEFIYKKIKPDLANNLQVLADEDDVFETKTSMVIGNFNYRNLEGDFNHGLTVYLYSEDGFLLDSTITSAGGQFMFRGLNPDKSYLFKMREDDPNFKMDDFTLFVEDRYGKVIADLYRAGDGFFRYKNIETENNNISLTPITVDTEENFELNLQTGDAFSIYFDLNSSYTNLKSSIELKALIAQMKSDQSIRVMISAYADCRSTDEYNLWLSERRGFRVKEFLMRHGISESRIKIAAFGESKLVNDCEDGSSCPDEEHALNRRVEISVIQ